MKITAQVRPLIAPLPTLTVAPQSNATSAIDVFEPSKTVASSPVRMEDVSYKGATVTAMNGCGQSEVPGRSSDQFDVTLKLANGEEAFVMLRFVKSPFPNDTPAGSTGVGFIDGTIRNLSPQQQADVIDALKRSADLKVEMGTTPSGVTAGMALEQMMAFLEKNAAA